MAHTSNVHKQLANTKSNKENVPVYMVYASGDTQGSTWVKNEVRHGHFKSCRSPTWPFIKTVESDVKVL